MIAETQILETVQSMPDEATMDDIVDQVVSVTAVDAAREDVEAGRVIPIDETEKQELIASIRQSQKEIEQGKGIQIEEVCKEIPKWENGQSFPRLPVWICNPLSNTSQKKIPRAPFHLATNSLSMR